MVLDAPNALGHCSGVVRERLRGGPGTLLDVCWPLLARPGRLKIGLWAAFGHPQTVPSASGRVPETVLSAQNGPRPIFRQFLIDLATFFVDFWPIFRRFFVRCLDILGAVSSAFVRVVPVFLCFVHLRSLAEHDRQTKRKKKKKRAGFASVLRLAARACRHDFHNPLRNLRANALHVRSSKPHLVCDNVSNFWKKNWKIYKKIFFETKKSKKKSNPKLFFNLIKKIY